MCESVYIQRALADQFEVIDPYYGADDGFEIAFEQMERFGKGFLRALGEDMVAED